MDEREIQKAIDKLAELIPNGHLLSTTGCANFINSVGDYVSSLTQEKKALHETRERMFKMCEKSDTDEIYILKQKNKALENEIAKLKENCTCAYSMPFSRCPKCSKREQDNG